MTCSVYCLVPSTEQLQPLVERLKDAGVASRDIMVVVREEAGSAPSTRAEATGWWSMPLGPAALWWMGLYGWSAVFQVRRELRSARDADDDREVEVISLARYRAGRRAGR